MGLHEKIQDDAENKHIKNSPNITFIHREDGRSYPENIGLSKQEAIEIIKNLRNDNYVETLSNENPPVDVYNKWINIRNRDLELYIKFYIKSHKFVAVISFHEKD